MHTLSFGKSLPLKFDVQTTLSSNPSPWTIKFSADNATARQYTQRAGAICLFYDSHHGAPQLSSGSVAAWCGVRGVPLRALRVRPGFQA